MKSHIAKCPLGLFSFDEAGKLTYYKLFDKDPRKALEQFNSSNEEFEKEALGEYSDLGLRFLREQFRYLSALMFESKKELNEFLSIFYTSLSKQRLRGSVQRDKILIQAFNALDDINRATNVFTERITELFTLHYPEASRKNIIKDILLYGNRENFPSFTSSTGVEITELDKEAIINFAKSIDELEKEKKSLERYVRNTAKELMPNTASIMDELLAVRLLARAGSMEKMARMSSSTVQLLGAEKALFRHLKKQGKSPKFGLIFMDSRIQNAKDKGKVARILSSTIMKTIRIDFYAGRDESREINKQLNDELRRVE